MDALSPNTLDSTSGIKIFSVMTARTEHSKPKYIEAIRGAFTVETQDFESGAGVPHSDSSGPALFRRRCVGTLSIRYCNSILKRFGHCWSKCLASRERFACALLHRAAGPGPTPHTQLRACAGAADAITQMIRTENNLLVHQSELRMGLDEETSAFIA